MERLLDCRRRKSRIGSLCVSAAYRRMPLDVLGCAAEKVRSPPIRVGLSTAFAVRITLVDVFGSGISLHLGGLRISTRGAFRPFVVGCAHR